MTKKNNFLVIYKKFKRFRAYCVHKDYELDTYSWYVYTTINHNYIYFLI